MNILIKERRMKKKISFSSIKINIFHCREGEMKADDDEKERTTDVTILLGLFIIRKVKDILLLLPPPQKIKQVVRL